MAYLVKLPDQREGAKEYANRPFTSTPAPPPAAGPAVTSAGANNGPQSHSGRFVAFDRYLNANGQAAANQVGRVGQGVEQAGQKTVDATRTLQNDFLGKMNAGIVKTPKEMGYTATHYGNPADPSRNIYTAGQFEDFTKQQYTGPNDLMGANQGLYNDAYGAAQDARAKADGLFRQGGLQQQLGTTGMGGALDEALVRRSGAERFRQLQSSYGNLTNWLDQQNTGSRQRADAARQASQMASQQYADEAARIRALEKASQDMIPPPGTAGTGQQVGNYLEQYGSGYTNPYTREQDAVSTAIGGAFDKLFGTSRHNAPHDKQSVIPGHRSDVGADAVTPGGGKKKKPKLPGSGASPISLPGSKKRKAAY